jgi:hypothetical protein
MLGAGENNFQVFFSSSDFINSDKTIYRYWLSDIDEEWKELIHGTEVLAMVIWTQDGIP